MVIGGGDRRNTRITGTRSQSIRSSPLFSSPVLEASTLAGLIAVPRMLERKVAAAEGDPPEKTRASAVPQHPLEPLTADEVTLAVETLKQGRKLGDSFRSAIRLKVANAPFSIGYDGPQKLDQEIR